MQMVSSDIFLHNRHLQSITLINTNLTWKHLRDHQFYSHLQYLILSKVILENIFPTNQSSNHPIVDIKSPLKTLVLENAGIAQLPHGPILSNYHNLDVLSLAYNRLSHLDGQTFYGLTLLRSLDLSGNSLSYLPDELLAYSPGLKYLYFADNKHPYQKSGWNRSPTFLSWI